MRFRQRPAPELAFGREARDSKPSVTIRFSLPPPCGGWGERRAETEAVEAGSFVPGGWVGGRSQTRVSLLLTAASLCSKPSPRPTPKHRPFPSLIICRPRVPLQHPRGLRAALETGASLLRPPRRRTRRRPAVGPAPVSPVFEGGRPPHVSFGFD
ncbi:hypothetical protein BHE74_00048521 [Ensete ventricosum]|nr:hypothetical protein BHE74_00048521 [Ensete ventricosum]